MPPSNLYNIGKINRDGNGVALKRIIHILLIHGNGGIMAAATIQTVITFAMSPVTALPQQRLPAA